MNSVKRSGRSGTWTTRSGQIPSRLFLTAPSDADEPGAHLHLLSRNIEKEISFDFGAESEFGYLYNQCYEMTTSECVPAATVFHPRVTLLGGDSPS